MVQKREKRNEISKFAKSFKGIFNLCLPFCVYWFVVSKREAIKVSLLSGRDTSLRGTEDTEFCPPLT